MTELAVVAGIAIVVLAGILAFIIYSHDLERQAWWHERRYLIDRAIAQHVGDVVALDRMDIKREADDPEPHRERPQLHPEGL